MLLTGFTEEELEEFFASVELRPNTKNTITTKEGLLKEIREVGERGYALDIKELDMNLHCIAAPIYDYRNGVAAALGVSGPSMRFSREKINRLVAPLLEITIKISGEMGYTKQQLHAQESFARINAGS